MKFLQTILALLMCFIGYTAVQAQSCSGTATFNVTINPSPNAIVTVGGNASGGGTPGLTSFNLCPTCKVYLKSNYTNLTNFTLKWYKNNNELTQYQNYLGGNVKKAGNYKLKVIRNSTGCEDFSQTVVVTGGAPMAAYETNTNVANTSESAKDDEVVFESADEAISLNLYPNPAQNRVTISYNPGNNNQVTMQVYDIMGRLQASQALALSDTNTTDLDVSNYPAGTYIVQLTGNTGSVTRSLTIAR